MSATVIASDMSQSAMEKIIVSQVEVISQKKGYILFRHKEVKMALVSDVKHDRMRIISAITEYAKLTVQTKDAVMQSNFSSALDARYGVSKGMLYSAYIHPMSPLTKRQLENALDQVASLARTFGSTYTSGALSFDDKPKSSSARPASKELSI